MEYIVERSLLQFEPWAGARVTWDELYVRNDLLTIEEYINEVCEYQQLTETAINDILWFEKDLIAEWLGYKDWEDYIQNKQPVYENKPVK